MEEPGAQTCRRRRRAKTETATTASTGIAMSPNSGIGSVARESPVDAVSSYVMETVPVPVENAMTIRTSWLVVKTWAETLGIRHRTSPPDVDWLLHDPIGEPATV